MIEEVTEYETVESTTIQYVSDFSGEVIDEEDVVEMHANPRIGKSGTESDGVLHLSGKEFAGLADEEIDPESLTSESELSGIVVKKLNPKVVKRPWILKVDGYFSMFLVTVLMMFNAYMVTGAYGKVGPELYAIISIALGVLVILGMFYGELTE